MRARSRMSVTPQTLTALGRAGRRRSVRGTYAGRAGRAASPLVDCQRDDPRPLSAAPDLLAFDREHVWHPYTSMTDPAPTRLVTGASGVRLRLADGSELVDGMSSWWAAIHGYNHPALNAGARRAGGGVLLMFGAHPRAVRLAQRLVELSRPGWSTCSSPTPGGERRGRAQDGAAVPARGRPARADPDADRPRRLPRRHVRLHERVRPGGRHALDVRRRAPRQLFADRPGSEEEWPPGRSRSRRWPPSTHELAGIIVEPVCRAPAACTSTRPRASR